ncbi:hypothetical protein, partial [Streptomyces sp. NPDC005012]|uniref:hypothetical protein n=1 Tax=Streptomyces sp. NPDC005012 TaxID=3154558 RepID=UPI0033BDD1E8
MADTDPLEYQQRKHPDLDITEHGLTLWDLERTDPRHLSLSRPRTTSAAADPPLAKSPAATHVHG